MLCFNTFDMPLGPLAQHSSTTHACNVNVTDEAIGPTAALQSETHSDFVPSILCRTSSASCINTQADTVPCAPMGPLHTLHYIASHFTTLLVCVVDGCWPHNRERAQHDHAHQHCLQQRISPGSRLAQCPGICFCVCELQLAVIPPLRRRNCAQKHFKAEPLQDCMGKRRAAAGRCKSRASTASALRPLRPASRSVSMSSAELCLH